MHDHFASWLRGVNVQLTNEVAKSRWEGVEAVVDWITQAEQVLALSLSALAVESVGADLRHKISLLIQERDASFEMIHNDAELAVLAASAIAQLLERDNEIADVAALCVATGTFGDREPEASPGLTLLARNYLTRRASDVRARVDQPAAITSASDSTKKVNKPAEIVSAAHLKDEEQGSFPAETTEALKEAVALLAEQLGKVEEDLTVLSNRLLENQALLSQESNILWWVMSGYSRDLMSTRVEASTAQLTLPVSRELADLSSSGVPPAASNEFLRYVLSSSNEEFSDSLTVMAAMEETTPEWRDRATSADQPDAAERLFPLLTGLRIGNDAPTSEEWRQVLLDLTGLSADFAAAPEVIGVQLLNELSLSCLLTNSSSAQDKG